MKRSGFFFLFSLAMLLSSTAVVRGEDESATAMHSWSFSRNAEGWRLWGLTSDAAKNGDSSFRWEASEAGDDGSIRIIDGSTVLNPYAINAPFAIDPQTEYVITGQVRSSDKLPAVLLILEDAEGGFVKTLEANAQRKLTLTPSQGRQGWYHFQMNIPVGSVPRAGLMARIAVRPSPDYNDRGYMGELEIDDVSWTPVGLSPISLKDAANRGFRDDVAGDGKGGWTDQGDNDVRKMPIGRQTFREITFDLIDPAENGDRTVIALKHQGTPTFGERAQIAVNGQRYDRIYLLQAAAWASDAARPIGDVTFVYANGEKHRHEVWLHRHISDWWAAPSQDDAVPVPLRKVNPIRDIVTAYIMPVENPHPIWPIERVELQIGQTDTVWLVMAITGERGPSKLEVSVAADRDTANWRTFVPSIRATVPGAVSLSGLLHAPAGLHGFVQVRNGQFVFEDGTPARFWGTNIHASRGLFPSKEEAELVADTLARYGCNLVRFHLPESVLIRTDVPDRQTFIDDEQWGAFDYLIKCLKDRGIYFMLDSITGLSGRRFQAADDVHAYDAYHPHKSWAFYDPRLQELGRQFMSKLLTHRNGYTGLRLVDDPALAAVVLINEQSVFWDMQHIELPDHYRQVLTARFNAWLADQYESHADLEKAWGSDVLASEDLAVGSVTLPPSMFGTDPSRFADAVRHAKAGERTKIADTVRFLQDIQQSFFSEMTGHARRLGLKSAVIGTNIIHHVGELQPMAELGTTSQNVYWNHARYSPESISTANVPEVVVNPLTSQPPLTESSLVGSKLAGAVGTSTENDTMWPHEWRSSHLMMTGATAAHQELGAVLQYGYGGGWGFDWKTMRQSQAILRPTVEFNDPAILSGFMAGAFLYLRSDVEPARVQVMRKIDQDLILSAAGRIRNGGFPLNYLPFVTGFNHALAASPELAKADYVLSDGQQDDSTSVTQHVQDLDHELKRLGLISPAVGLQDDRLVSDTGQLVRDWKRHVFLVNTPRSQGFTGFAANRELSFESLNIQSHSTYATVLVSSLDNEPIATAKRLFVIAVGRADNRDAKVTFATAVSTPDGNQRGEQLAMTDFEAGPVAIEPIDVTLRLSGDSVRLIPLGPDMVPIEDAATEIVSADGTAAVRIQGGLSCWYLLERVP